jgi:hypothetical protein
MGIEFAAWALAGWLLVAAPAPAAAQDATPIAIDVGAQSTTAAQPTAAAAVGGNAPRVVPATGVGSTSADIASGWLALGASVGAVVAGVVALRDRFRDR